MSRRSGSLLRIVCGVAAASALTVVPSGQDLKRPGPGVRNAHGLAFDGQVVLLFGGADEGAVRGDSWGWTGSAWRQFDVPGPAARTFPVMVAAEPGEVYLFGGRRMLFGQTLDRAQFLDDFWRWDGARWSSISAVGPPARAEAAAAWDAGRRKLVLFGGYTVTDGTVVPLGDTWEYSDGRWTDVSASGPSARHGASAAYDATTRQVVVYGGNGPSNETWAWNGSRWRRLNLETAARYNSAMMAGGLDTPIARRAGNVSLVSALRRGTTQRWRSTLVGSVSC